MKNALLNKSDVREKFLVIALAVIGIAIIYQNLKPKASVRDRINSEESIDPEFPPLVAQATPQSDLSRPNENNAAIERPDSEKFKPPAKIEPPVASESTPGPGTKFSELQRKYAVEDLRHTLKLATPEVREGSHGAVLHGVFKLQEGGLVAWHGHLRARDGDFQPESCIGIRLPDGQMVIGKTEDRSLSNLLLPGVLGGIRVVQGTYYFLTLIEAANPRAEPNEHQASLFYLYKKQPTGEIKKIGEHLRLSVSDRPHRHTTDMNPLDFCENVPEPSPE